MPEFCGRPATGALRSGAMRNPRLLLAAATLFLTAGPALCAAELWLYSPTNLLVDDNLTKLEALWKRAAAAGYTHVLLTDSKMAKLGDLGDLTAHYMKNVARAKTLAADLKLELVPALFDIGYSNNSLWHDPNLIEAMLVREAPLVVQGGVARLVNPEAPKLPETGFADLKRWSWHDDNVVADAGAARMDANGSNARIAMKLKVQPLRQYHVSVRLKTQDFAGARPEVKALAGNATLNWDYLHSKPTQDWTLQHVIFNSQANTEVMLFFGAWGATGGHAWWSEPKLEEVAFVNLTRRPGTPLVITSEDGHPLTEGGDFEPLSDPNLGNHPWKGDYDVYHEPPLLRTKLADGTKLRASYYHGVTIYEGQAGMCPSEPKTTELLRDEARRVHAAFGAKNYMMSHDEVRVLGWCEACRRRHLTPGAILADNLKTCTQIMHEVAPGARLHVWSDMFDPSHNAVKGPYYLVNGSLEGSWEGLDPSVVVLPWYYSKRDASLKFFAARGNRQVIAGYYDSQPEKIADWLTSAKAVPKSVLGVMYTTWENKYVDLEKFAEVAKAN